MQLDDKNIDRLFETASKEEPHYAFDDLRHSFVNQIKAPKKNEGFKNLIKNKGMILSVLAGVVSTASIALGVLYYNTDNNLVSNADYENTKATIYYKKTATNYLVEVDLIKATSEANEPVIARRKIIKLPTKTIDQIGIHQDVIKLKKPRPQIKSYQQRFEITAATTLFDLDKIKDQAKSEGLDFDYSAQMEANELKRLRYSITPFNSEEVEDLFIDLTSSKPLVIGWTTDENGVVQVEKSLDVIPLFEPTIDDSLEYEKVPSYAQKFEFNQSTTDEEFEAMKEVAKNNGITLTYKRKFKGQDMVSMEVSMIFKSMNLSAVQTLGLEFPKDDGRSATIGWCNDEKGKFKQFRSGTDAEYVQSKRYAKKNPADFPNKYHITTKTTKEELEVIYATMTEAEIVPHLKSRYRFKRLNQISITMTIGKEGQKGYHYTAMTTSLDSSDEIIIMWKSDANGKATDFYIQDKNHTRDN